MRYLLGAMALSMLLAGCGTISSPGSSTAFIDSYGSMNILRHQGGSDDKKQKWCPPGQRDDAESGECPPGHQ